MTSVLKPAATVLGLGVARAACCSGPIAGAVVWGVGLAGLGTAWLGWGVGLAIFATLAVSALLYKSRKTQAASCVSTTCQRGSKLSCKGPARHGSVIG